MSYLALAYIHLATVLPAFVIGTVQMLGRKGSPRHKGLGYTYMLLMLVTAITALFMPAKIGPVFFGHFGPVHLFCLLTLYAVPVAYFAVKRQNLRVHKRAMILLYVGGIIIAGSFAFMPGRMLNQLLFVD
ncbi:DUF2306 domain-containing protein [Gallaecimonas mangrovi]|uniref:DUF2306 domain-containing protein n=1 Tax=Gallaecimonas mangrovi TaxID=2291597 RepID=UPI000E202911|nr:DUF2306 domain-containing protein [Gallaecimonas mangrovi]